MIWFKFYSAWSEGIQELSDAEAGRFIKALCACAESEETPSLYGAEKVLYAIASKQLKQDAERNAEISRTRAEAGRMGGLSSKANGSKTSKCKQTEAKQANANKCSIKNKELRIKNQEEESRNNFAETDVSAPEKPKLTPDDHDFWNFAKENAELAETFYRTTGIYPVKSQFGRWTNDLRDLAEAGIDSERLKKTIDYMESQNIPLSAPGSCLKTAQYLKARGSVPRRKTETTQDRWDAAAEQLKAELENQNAVYALFGGSESEVYDL